MPKLFNNLHNNQYVSQHVGLPIEQVDQLGTVLETRYNNNLQAADKLEVGLSNLDVRDVNAGIVKGKLDSVRASLADTVAAGNWENASMLVRQQAKDVATDPMLRGALDDKAQFDAWSSELAAGLKDGTYNKEQYNYYMQKAAEQNNKPVEVDPDTGAVSNIFSFGKPTADMSGEIRDYMTELSKLWKSNTDDNPVAITYKNKAGKKVQGAIMYRDGTTGSPPGYYDVQQKKYITQEEVRSAMTAAVMGDPKYRSFIEESSRIKAWKAEQQNGGVFTLNDLAGPTNPNAVFTAEEFTELEAALTAQGKDMATMLQDPDMVKALFLLGSRNEIIDGMIEAPVQATAFEETTHKFLADIEFREALKLRNDLAKVRAQGREARKTQKAKQDYERAEKAQFVVKNRGPVIDKTEVDNRDIAQSLGERQTRLAQLEAQIESHRNNGKSPNDISKLEQEKAQLETQIAIQQGSLKSKTSAYYSTPEGEKFIKDQYERYKEFNPRVREDLSFEEFKAKVITPEPKASNWFGRLVNATASFTEGLAPKNDASRYNDFMQTTHNDLMSRVNKVEANDELPGLSGNTYDSEDLGNKSAIFRVANETKTRAYKQNRTGYYIPNENGGELDAAQWEAAIRKEYGDNNVDIKIVTSDADHSTGGVALFPDKIAVIDKNTGETLREDWIYPIDGGADEMLQVGVRGRQDFPRGSAAYEDATRMAAMGTYTELIQNDLNEASEYVTPGSGLNWVGEPVTLPGPNGSILVRPRKVDQVNYDPETGAKLGYNTRWMLESVDEKGNSLGFVPNLNYFDEQGEVQAEGITDKNQLYQFENINDAKVSMYKMNNGE